MLDRPWAATTSLSFVQGPTLILNTRCLASYVTWQLQNAQKRLSMLSPLSHLCKGSATISMLPDHCACNTEALFLDYIDTGPLI